MLNYDVSAIIPHFLLKNTSSHHYMLDILHIWTSDYSLLGLLQTSIGVSGIHAKVNTLIGNRVSRGGTLHALLRCTLGVGGVHEPNTTELTQFQIAFVY